MTCSHESTSHRRECPPPSFVRSISPSVGLRKTAKLTLRPLTHSNSLIKHRSKILSPPGGLPRRRGQKSEVSLEAYICPGMVAIGKVPRGMWAAILGVRPPVSSGPTASDFFKRIQKSISLREVEVSRLLKIRQTLAKPSP